MVLECPSEAILFEASRNSTILTSWQLSCGLATLRKALDSFPNLFGGCIRKVQAHESLTGNIGEEISARYK
jgi:hypothetical protein